MSQKQLTENLIAQGVLKTPEIIRAFLAVDRADFVWPQDLGAAYEDFPLSIGQRQTISQPYTVAFMLELLQPASGGRILDIGSGSGWTTALLAQIAGREGRVWGIEIVLELVRFGSDNLSKYHYPWASIGPAETAIGLEKEAPFDRILVSAAGDALPPGLIDQLKPGGRLVLPVRNSIWLIIKDKKSKITKKEFPGFIFVPLK